MPIQKHALVVDDSKSARLVLRRMLEKYTLAVDTANSAGEALEYLNHNRPDVIFMDHMMPGMDGFEAVKAIKNNPATATIPILMYTSKGGDLYLSQARALGAAGILPKSVAPAELFDSLERLGLVHDRREESASIDDEPASERALDIHQRSIGLTSFYDPDMSVNIRTAPPDELDTRIRKLLDEQRVELRKDILVSMETVSKRVGAKIDHEIATKLELQAAPIEPAAQTPVVPGLLGVLLCASLAWSYSLYQDNKSLQGVPASKHAPAVVPQATSHIEPMAKKAAVTAVPNWAIIDWAMNQTLAYPYDEIALDKARLDTVDALLKRLADSGFKGKVVLQTHAGEFCMLGNEDSGFRLPPPELPIDKCDFIGNPEQPADTPASHQSLAFANFYNSTPYLAAGSPISLEITALPRSTPLVVYPVRLEGTTASDWNSAAEKNNRIILRLEPQ